MFLYRNPPHVLLWSITMHNSAMSSASSVMKSETGLFLSWCCKPCGTVTKTPGKLHSSNCTVCFSCCFPRGSLSKTNKKWVKSGFNYYTLLQNSCHWKMFLKEWIGLGIKHNQHLWSNVWLSKLQSDVSFCELPDKTYCQWVLSMFNVLKLPLKNVYI